MQLFVQLEFTNLTLEVANDRVTFLAPFNVNLFFVSIIKGLTVARKQMLSTVMKKNREGNMTTVIKLTGK